MATVYLGIGSNLGNRSKNIESAISFLQKSDLTLLKRSTVIETNPVGGPPGQEKFLNGVLKIKTELSPEELLHRIKKIEKDLGRTKAVRNGPRLIDIDILLYNDLDLQLPHLTIPHPRMYQRDFVMKPLAEIEPQLVKELTHARH